MESSLAHQIDHGLIGIFVNLYGEASVLTRSMRDIESCWNQCKSCTSTYSVWTNECPFFVWCEEDEQEKLKITCGTGLAFLYTWHALRPQYYAAMRWKFIEVETKFSTPFQNPEEDSGSKIDECKQRRLQISKAKQTTDTLNERLICDCTNCSKNRKHLVLNAQS